MADESPSKLEAYGNHADGLRQVQTPGGHPLDSTQPALPIYHRKFANPAPLGLLSFATSMFLISSFGLQAQGVSQPNLMIAVLIFFAGICQYLVGIFEFVSGNTFGCTVFASYAAFNTSYGMIYLPGTGIIAAYTDKATGQLNDDFSQAIALYLWAWFIITVLYTVASMRSSWALFFTLASLALFILLLACGFMTGHTGVVKGGYAIGYVVAALSYYTGCAGLYDATTPIKVPVFPMYKED